MDPEDEHSELTLQALLGEGNAPVNQQREVLSTVLRQLSRTRPLFLCCEDGKTAKCMHTRARTFCSDQPCFGNELRSCIHMTEATLRVE